jgi:hypothetical protein
MPNLELKPTIHDFDRDTLEQWLDQVRARRMSAAIEYFANKNAKVAHEADKIQKKFLGQVEMLGKEIVRLEAAEARVMDRLITIDMLKQELGLLSERMIDTNEGDSYE